MRDEAIGRLTRGECRRSSAWSGDQSTSLRREIGVFVVFLGWSLWAAIASPAIALSQEVQPQCESLKDKQSRVACFERNGTPVVDCDRPQNPSDEAFCREVTRNTGAAINTNPIVQWCREHTNPATCPDVNSCVAMCVQRSGQHDPAAIAAQLQKEHEAKQSQEQYQAEVADKLRLAQQRGYRPISFNDFKLDGKELAGNQAKVLLRGFYTKSGEIDFLQPTGLSVAVSRKYDVDSGIPLLTEDATRNARAFFLQCSQNILAQLGCPVTIVGRVDVCTMANVLGSKSVPCITVEDGWQ